MAGPIEQLRYTWAARGAEGVNRFQIAALSLGLRSPEMGPLLPVIRKICRYDRPQREDDGALPVSFGWFDHREHRVAFSRVGVPRSQDRRGNFAAHVVVAPAGVLSEADLASTFGAPFWWTGHAAGAGEAAEDLAEAEGFQLPAVERAELLRDRVEPPSEPPLAALVLAQGLLSLPADGRLSVLDHDGWFGPALRVLARRLPEALDGVSLSTYEAGASSVPFDAIGTNRAAGRGRQCDLADGESLDPEARRLLEELLGAGEEPERLRAAARGRVPAGGRRGEALWRTADRLRALARSESAIDAPAADALATPSAILYLSRVPAGVANVAAAARGGGAAILTALRSAWGEMDGEPRDALGDALVDSHLAAGDLGGIAALVETLPTGPPREAMLERVLGAALDDEGLARSLRAEDAVLLVDRAARRGTSVAEGEALLHGAARHLGSCAEISTLPRPYLAAMWRTALVEGGDDAALAAALLRHPALLVEIELGEEEKDRCMALLERLPPPRLERALPALLPRLAQQERRARLDATLRRLSTGSAGRVLVQSMANAREWRGAPSAVLSEMCDDGAVPLIAAGVAPLALELLDLSRSENGRRAADLLRATIVRSHGSALEAARGTATLEHHGLRAAIAERAIVCAVDEVRRPEEVAAVWRTLAELSPEGSDSERLGLLLTYCRQSDSSGAAAAVLAWMASFLLPANPELLARGARLRDREAEDLALELVAGVFWHDMIAMEPAIERADRRCRSWWKGLDAHRRKEAKRREREEKKARR